MKPNIMNSSDINWYYCFDGDRIGERIELYLMKGDLKSANTFSSVVRECMDDISSIMKKQGAVCLFRGGDSLIFGSIKAIISEELPTKFEAISFSVGVGSKLESAILSLFKAKALGRCRVERWHQ
jgi:GTP cyclohydrolase III